MFSWRGGGFSLAYALLGFTAILGVAALVPSQVKLKKKTVRFSAANLEIRQFGGEFAKWTKEVVIDGSIAKWTLRWSTLSRTAKSGTWAVASEALNSWPAPDASKVLASGKTAVPKAGKVSTFSVDLGPFLSRTAPEQPKTYYVRVFLQDAARKSAGASNVVKIIHQKPGPGPKLNLDPEPPKPKVIPAGHPRIVCVRFEPLTRTTPGKLVVRAYNPAFGANPANTQPATVKIRDLNLVARPKEGAGSTAQIPSLMAGQSVDRTFVMVPQLTVGQPTVEGNWKKWAERAAKGVHLLAMTSLQGSLAETPHLIVRWPLTKVYDHEPMHVRGPAERSLDTSVAPPTPETTLQLSRLASDLLVAVKQPGASRAGSDVADSPLNLPSATILKNTFLVDPGLGGLDTNIAVGTQHFLITTGTKIGFYTKAGQKLKTKDGSKTIDTMSMKTFFDPVVEDIRWHLNLSMAEVNKGFDNMSYYDARCLYDSYRKRFWVVALVTNKFTVEDTKVSSDLVARRNKIACAVSKTTDPRDGFWMYWWDATPYDGTPNSDWKAGDAGDYPSLGISQRFFMQTNHVRLKTGTDSTARWAMVTMVSADALAGGSAQFGWMFPRLKDPKGKQIFHVSMPATQFGSFPNERAYLTKSHNETGDPRVLVYGFDAFGSFPRHPRLVSFSVRPYTSVPNAPQKRSADVPDPSRVKLSNIGVSLLQTVARGNRLWTVHQEGVTWSGASESYAAVRYIRADLSRFAQGLIPTTKSSGFVQRTFGKRNKSESSASIFGYGMPGVMADSSGNAIVGYVRSGFTIYAEARFTVHYGGESDIRPSLRMQAGEGTYPGDSERGVGQLDCVGAALDPDGKTIWIAVPYAYRADSSKTEAKWRVAVGRIRL